MASFSHFDQVLSTDKDVEPAGQVNLPRQRTTIS